MEYVPACTEAALDYSNDLASNGTGPKNTARWRLCIPGSVLETNRFVNSAFATLAIGGVAVIVAVVACAPFVAGWFDVPALPFRIRQQADMAGKVHTVLAHALIVLAVGHGLAALKHHFIDKDRTLLRMLLSR